MSKFGIGQTVGKYKLVELLGRGGMAEVYKGYQETLDRNVAIKVMHAFLASDKSFLGRFQREARAMAALNHPNIVGVYDFDVVDDSYYIVMEYVGHGTLKDRMETASNRGQIVPLGEAVRLVLEIAEALAYAHSRGMFHRDIKPANILINEAGTAILTDFGIAKMLSGPSHTATGSMIGTPAYMSPEQGLGQPGDHRSDIYSLGVLFFQLVTGSLPYQADTPLAIVMKHVNEPVPTPTDVNPAVPAPIQQTIFRAMAKSPEERYQSAGEMARELRSALRQINDSGLIGAVPRELLRDRPTPPPVVVPTNTPPPPDRTVVAGRVGQTAMAGTGSVSADATQVAPTGDRTEVMSAPPRPPGAPPATATASGGGRSRVPAIIGGLAALLLVGALVVAGIIFFNNRGDDPTPTQDTIAGGGDVTDDETPVATQDVAGTLRAIQTADAANQPTETPTLTPTPTIPTPTVTSTPTPTETPTVTPTPDLTATAIADCTYEVTFVQHFTYANRNFENVARGAGNFPLNLVFENTGTCALPLVELALIGDDAFSLPANFGANGPFEPGEEFVVSVTAVAPDTLGTYEFEGSLISAIDDSTGVGLDFAFDMFVFEPATPTPVATATPAASPTPDQSEALDFFWEFIQCEYIGGNQAEYRCQMNITVYGGLGAPYTILVFDSSPASEYRTDSIAFHFFQARRCDPWIHEIRVVDVEGASPVSKNVFFSPEAHPELFPGGMCTEN